MSLPTLDEIINTIIREKRLLASVIKRNLSFAKHQIVDVPLGCPYCSRSSTQVYYMDIDTLMGQLSIRICQNCYNSFKLQAAKEQELKERGVKEEK